MIDAGTTMFIIKLGKRMPDDLSVAREAKVKPFLQFQLLIVFFARSYMMVAHYRVCAHIPICRH